jgi:hypothetical protein
VLSTVATYKMYSADMTRSLANVSKEPLVARDTEYYLANITKVKSIDDFLNNDRLYRYAMKAFGLEDMIYAKAFMRKVLTEGIDTDKSFANTLTDPRYKEFASTFNFARYGDVTTVFDRTQQGTADMYVRQTLEEKAGDQNQGVRLALYFQRKASSITEPLQLLADPALAQVTRTLIGLPEQAAGMDIDKQAALIKDRLNLEDFQDPAKLEELITRFTAMYEMNNPQTATISPMAALFTTQPLTSGLSNDLLASIQKLPLGGL